MIGWLRCLSLSSVLVVVVVCCSCCRLCFVGCCSFSVVVDAVLVCLLFLSTVGWLVGFLVCRCRRCLLLRPCVVSCRVCGYVGFSIGGFGRSPVEPLIGTVLHPRTLLMCEATVIVAAVSFVLVPVLEVCRVGGVGRSPAYKKIHFLCFIETHVRAPHTHTMTSLCGGSSFRRCSPVLLCLPCCCRWCGCSVFVDAVVDAAGVCCAVGVGRVAVVAVVVVAVFVVVVVIVVVVVSPWCWGEAMS